MTEDQIYHRLGQRIETSAGTWHQLCIDLVSECDAILAEMRETQPEKLEEYRTR